MPNHLHDERVRSRVPEYEWNFDEVRVPNAEVQVCCYWEYARESDYIRRLWKETVSVASPEAVPKVKIDEVRQDFYRLFNALGRRSILFQHGIYGFGGDGLCKGFNSPFPKPWQKLSRKERRILIETASWDVQDSCCPIPGFRRAQAPYLDALAKHFQPKTMKEVFGGDGRIGMVQFFHAGRKLRAICPNLMTNVGSELFLAEIAWGEFTNAQLIEHFVQWLKENEPEGIKRPAEVGHKPRDWQAMVERLGIMRLRQHHSFEELQAIVSATATDAYAFRDKFLVKAKCKKEREKSLENFRDLFQFLPAEVTPRSWVMSSDW